MNSEFLEFTKDELNILKEIYKLWWQYLQLSIGYEKFCIMMSEKEQFEIKDRDIFEEFQKNFPLKYIPPRCRKEVIYYLPDETILKRYWDFFGNVHDDNFEEWWNIFKASIFKEYVIDLRDDEAVELLPIFHAVTRRYRREHPKRIPTEEEMLGLLTSETDYVFVAVPLWDLTIQDIGQQINKLRIEQRKRWPKRFRLIGMDIKLDGRVQLEELKRYIKYYILIHEGKLSPKELEKKREEEERLKEKDNPKSYNEIRKLISSDCKRAEKIIKNVEKGIFPGSYQPKK